MNLKEYQEKTKLTAIYPQDKALEYLALGLVSEAGEVAGKAKKVIRDSQSLITEERKDAIKDEIGDVLWYLSELCNLFKVSIEDLLQQNIDKLLSRKERGKLQGSGDNR